MQSRLNGSVTYLALQRLVEKAWDEQDQQRLMRLSRAVDTHMLARIEAEILDKEAV